MYYDLNVRPKSSRDKERLAIVKRHLELGYSCIVWNTAVFSKLSHSSQIKPAPAVSIDAHTLTSVRKHRAMVLKNAASEEIRQFTRVTLVIDDIAEAHAIAGYDWIKQFDIIAVCPGNLQVFAHLCKCSDVDIITFDFTHRIPFPINKKLLDEAVKKDIVFEIPYSNIFTNATHRRQLLANSGLLLHYLKGRNVVFTSGAEAVSQLRAPLDVMNIAHVCGVLQHMSNKTVSENCALVLKHAAARRLRYCPIEVISMDEFIARWPEHNMHCTSENVTSKDSTDSDVEVDEVSEVAEATVAVDSELLTYDVEASTEEAFSANSLEFVKLGDAKELKNVLRETEKQTSKKRETDAIEIKKKIKKHKVKL